MDTVKPYKNDASSKKHQVAMMFDAIAVKYDFLNHLLSLGIDKSWRRKAIKIIRHKKVSQLLDIATGTADFAIEASKIEGLHVTGIDISEQMLAVGREKISKLGLSGRIQLQQGDSENIQFADNTFDAITVAFGVRNFENLSKGLQEMQRVLKPGATLIVLEFSKPKNIFFKSIYQLYFRFVLPGIGQFVSKDKSAYTYLPESVNKFPDGIHFLNELENVGFHTCSLKRLTFGVATIYVGYK